MARLLNFIIIFEFPFRILDLFHIDRVVRAKKLPQLSKKCVDMSRCWGGNRNSHCSTSSYTRTATFLMENS